jgi:NADP+-dependent farnesol dehydrogenase
MLNLERWRGNVALVTGAASGIGRATAKALCGIGMRVAAADRNMAGLQHLRDDLRLADSDVLPIAVEMGDEASIRNMYAALAEQLGTVDVVVNCAALGYHGTVAAGDTAQWRAMMEVNFLGFSISLREALAQLRGKAQGQIVTISSLSAHRILQGSGITFYAATKHALRCMVDGLRLELAAEQSPIKLGMISPGLVDTGMLATSVKLDELGLDPKDRSKFLDPADIANAVLYLLATPPTVQVHEVQVRPIGQLT